MRVLGIYDGSGTKYHRILLPLSLMPGVTLTISDTINGDNADCDILFFNRAISRTSLNEILRLKKLYGFTMICDLDDHWRLSPDHNLYEHYRVHRLTELIGYYIAESDHITVTHERLADEAAKVNQRVTILPNAIPYFGQFTYPKTNSEFIRLFWAGSSTHEKDMELLRGPLRRIGDLSVQMVMGGYVKGHPALQRIASAFTNGGHLRHNLIENLPVDQYYGVYSECDISLIPLTISTFNQYKSNLKILEAANNGSPVIVSAVHPYMGFPDEIVNYVRSSKDWNRHIRRLVTNPGYAKEQGEALKLHCRQHFNFYKINQQRADLFKSIYARTGKIQEQV